MSRYGLLGWLASLEETGEDVAEIPPLRILSQPDILERGWGWQRLLPYEPYSVEWPRFKAYLQDYYNKNVVQVAALIMENKPDCYVWGIPSNFNASHAAADLCVKSEDKLQSLPRTLGDEDTKLSLAIKEHARLAIESGDVSFLTAPGFVCIMKEAELMYQLLQCKFDSANLISFSNQIRRSALNLMMCKVDESTAVPAAAAMVGLAREAKVARYVLARDDCDHYLDYDVCDTIREGTIKVLTKLEKEFASDTAGRGGATGASTAHKSKAEASTATRVVNLAEKPLAPPNQVLSSTSKQ